MDTVDGVKVGDGDTSACADTKRRWEGTKKRRVNLCISDSKMQKESATAAITPCFNSHHARLFTQFMKMGSQTIETE